MTRPSLSPAAKAAATQRYLGPSEPQDPLEPLLEAVQKAIVQHVTMVQTHNGGSALRVENLEFALIGADTPQAGQPILELRSALEHVVADALRSSIGAHTPEGRRIRLVMAQKLLTIEMGESGLERAEPPEDDDDAWLKTADVAVQLGMSRPYVSMLCDAGKLGEVSKTEGGHRRIRQSAVTAHLAAQTTAGAGAESPREAAMAAGMYDVSDRAYSQAARRPTSKPEGQSARSKSRPSRASKR